MADLFLALLSVLGSTLIGLLAFGPISNARERPFAKTTFSLMDLYVVIGQIALVNIVLSVGGSEARKVIGALTVSVALAAWWWMGVRWLEMAWVTNRRRRAVFLGIACPIGFGGAIPLIMPGVGWIMQHEIGNISPAYYMASMLVLVVCQWVAWEISRWVVS